MQRIEIEFREEQLGRADYEMMDSFFEHKRWLKSKEKALQRDLQRDRHALRERTVAMIEAQVEESRLKLQKDLELSKLKMKQEDLRGELTE